MFFRDTDFDAVDTEIEQAIADRARSDTPMTVPVKQKTAPTEIARTRATSFYAPGHEPDISQLSAVSLSDRMVGDAKPVKVQATRLSGLYTVLPVILVFAALRSCLPLEVASTLTAIVVYITSYAAPTAYDVTELRRTVVVLAIFNTLLQVSFSVSAVAAAVSILAVEAANFALARNKGRAA